MAAPLSQVVSLATSMHAQPGVYAVLLGSGVSTGAGIPTGWGVVRELVGRIAAASDPQNPDAAKAAWDDPEAWWADHGDGDLGYSTLLEQLAPLPAARQGLLSDFFEPSEEEREEGLKQPSRAHLAVADLVKRGFVRVIVTTNFDRLMERALEAVGVSPQVISRPEAINGMAPLAHSPATLIKLHGDYKDLGSRNTPEELGDYPEEWKRLLAQVFNEYGLLISGWSADWDEALVAALESAPNRRYPLFWDARSSKGENAARLLSARAGIAVPAASADDLFSELVGSLDALEKLASPPLSTAMAVARLKRYLPDPIRRIDLHDLVMDATDQVVAAIAAQPVTIEGQLSYELLQGIYDSHFRSMKELSQLLATAVWHDVDGVHDRLWVDVLQKLVDAGTAPLSSWNDALEMARRFPAFIALAIVGVTSIRRGRDDLIIRLATDAEGRNKYNQNEREPAAQSLHYLRLASDDWVDNLPRWGTQRWLYPTSHLFVTDLRGYFADSIPVDDEFQLAYQSFEYRLGLVQERTPGKHAISGEYVGEWRWEGDVPKMESALRRQIERGQAPAWQAFYGGTAELETALVAQRETLKRYVRW
ncbi:SIR2 family protein [Microbacterium sp. AZCO]|uniref:SIR2 family protein n=1 Tax=Microbacterium sp. AZCO TaxID=3142976 RepID=UPI0031F36316